MIGHDDISPNSPATTAASRAPFFYENLSRLVVSEDSLSVAGARGDVINRKIDPNPFETSQMFVHDVVVAEGVDLGEAKDLPRAQSPRSAPAATTSAKQKPIPGRDRKFFPPQSNRSG